MNTDVSALLLAAGLGTRLKPLTDKIPKCLVPINGAPLLGIWLDHLTKAGIDDIIINTHHHATQVINFIRTGPYIDIVTLAHEDKLLGTAGMLLANARRCLYDTILLAHADNLSRFDVKAFIRAHETRPKHTVLTMMVFNTDAPQNCGIVELDKDGVVTAFHEKQKNPPGNLANAAVYLMNRRFVESLDKNISDFSTEVLPKLMGRIFTFYNKDYHRDIGTVEGLALAQRMM